MANSIQRLPTVLDETGYSRSTIYLYISEGLWPKPIKIGVRSVGWMSTETELMNAARISGKSDDEIRALVKRLETARSSIANVLEARDMLNTKHLPLSEHEEV